MSRGPRWHICGLFCALTLSPAAAHGEDSAEAPASTSVASATPPGAKVTAGQLVAEEKTFVAGPEGAALELVEGALLRLDPGTRLRFGRTFKLPMGSGPESIIPTRVLMLDSGWMEASLLANHFALFVEAPRKLRSILLAGALTAIATEPRSTVALEQGNALVALDDSWKWKRLSEGSMQIVSQVRPDGYRRSILPPTQPPVLSHSLMLASAGDDTATSITWPALPQAVGYEVQLRAGELPAPANAASAAGANAAQPQNVASPPAAPPAAESLVRSVRSKEPRASVAGLAPGHYQVMVRGQDDSGIFGPLSPPTALNVVGLDIPKTASRGPHGSVRLQPNQRVTLIGAEGLQVAYLGLDDFLPAPKSVGLVARRPISLVLRHPVSGETTRLDLEPLNVHAQISFARHPHSWPSEGLELAVKLVDDKGEPVPQNFVVSCQVSINIQPVEPTWERTGSVLRTRLAQPIGAAPWMVRVDVLDENGASLGMDFVEVGYEAGYDKSAAHARR